MDDHPSAWAEEEFGNASLGDVRRNRRFVAIATQLARLPAPRITAAFRVAADREAAYRAVENPAYSYEDLGWPMRQATARRGAEFTEVIVPVDGASLAVRYGGVGFGPVSNKTHGNGVQVMTAYALSPDGVPLGILGQEFWTRTAKHAPTFRKDRRPTSERETGYWLSTMGQAQAALRSNAPATTPWFQLDRGGDCGAVLRHARLLGADATIRACYDRVVTGGKLWGKAAAGTYLGQYLLKVGKPNQARRLVTIAVRAREVELHLRRGGKGQLTLQKMWVVEARELGRRTDRVLWRLLTTKVVTTFGMARRVINAYAWRWRIEEFHRAWKTGACGIEQCWLRLPESYCKWATILAAVAARLERIKHLSRTEPERSALDEYTRDEIDAIILLRKPKGVPLGATPTLGVVTLWVAELGSYTGKSSGGPPGIIVISRGFAMVEIAVQTMLSLRNRPDSRG